MAEKKTILKCYGPPDLIKELEECHRADEISGTRSFSGFKLDRRLLHKEACEEAECRVVLKVKDKNIEISSEFSIEGFCNPAVFEARWTNMSLGNHNVSHTSIGSFSNPYEVSMEGSLSRN